MNCTRSKSPPNLALPQDSYIENIAARFNLDQLHGSPSTPMTSEPLIPNDEVADQAFIHLCQRKVGSIIYAAVITRPDIARRTAILSTPDQSIKRAYGRSQSVH